MSLSNSVHVPAGISRALKALVYNFLVIRLDGPQICGTVGGDTIDFKAAISVTRLSIQASESAFRGGDVLGSIFARMWAKLVGGLS